ncbi:HEAT repeat domain-containing protein [Hymenobacter lapidiphilus]|uniref:HEAT repeat domain-containing protein n=1 Tax=Hymenobacter sp. CCM 8763 TaxID=2303334 RepID=UPI000E353ADD|nr:HEAT repeat domain-containing protein [Hymenobacter sp. CCM 8763]RFP64045.1 HEAT repeat domain-containing protein [Hymenobacter sp. CCM 8763]
MNKKQRVEYLKAAVFSEDWNVAQDACGKLFHFGGRFNKTKRKKHRQFLIQLLDQEKPRARNAAALTFRLNRYSAAVIPLLHAITKPENSKNRGTLVYALEKLKCHHHLGDLFSVLFGATGNWEVQNHTLRVLEEQIFEFTREEVQKVAKDWNVIRDNWNILNSIDEKHISQLDFDRKLIQSFVDDYLVYLQ